VKNIVFFFKYDSEIRRRSEEWNTSRSPRQLKISMSKIKIQENSRCSFFVSRGVIRKKFAQPRVTVTKKYYLEVLDSLREKAM
jgi:hypothetical protein